MAHDSIIVTKNNVTNCLCMIKLHKYKYSCYMPPIAFSHTQNIVINCCMHDQVTKNFMRHDTSPIYSQKHKVTICYVHDQATQNFTLHLLSRILFETTNTELTFYCRF